MWLNTVAKRSTTGERSSIQDRINIFRVCTIKKQLAIDLVGDVLPHLRYGLLRHVFEKGRAYLTVPGYRYVLSKQTFNRTCAIFCDTAKLVSFKGRMIYTIQVQFSSLFY